MDEALVFRGWAIERALPLWLAAGTDRATDHFEEQLDFAGAPVRTVPRRVMVQARQIAVYALATRRGWIDARSPALQAGTAMVERFWATDGADGWVFSLTRDGAVADPKRDLYAHAFVLFALAGLLSLDPASRPFADAVDRTIRFIDATLVDPAHGGCWDCLPRPDTLRRQNPHMHLLEAYLELYEVTGEPRFLKRSADLVTLACTRFLDVGTGMLREFFDDRWTVAPAPGQGAVEPGHQFEWAWLLRRYERLSGRHDEMPVDSLVRAALRHGVDPANGRIVDQIDETGRATSLSSRCWPYCEAIKSLSVESAIGTGDHRPLIGAMFGRLNQAYCQPAGGWIDHLDQHDRPISAVMPASTLYHLMFALAEWEQAFQPAFPHARSSRR